MVFAVTARHSGNSGQATVQTLTTDSATETANSLLLIGSCAQNDLHTNSQSPQAISGGSLPYSLVAESGFVGWDGSESFGMRGAVHSAPIGGSPSAHTITVDHYTASTVTGAYSAVAIDVTGHDAADPIVQFATNEASSDPGSGTVTLTNTPAIGNQVVVFFFSGADAGGGFAPPTLGGQPMVQRWNQDDSWTQSGCWFREIDGTESDNVITCTNLGDSVGQFAAVAVELLAEAGGGQQDVSLVGPTVAVTPGTLTVTPGQVDITLVGPVVSVTSGVLTVTPGQVGIDLVGPIVSVSPGTLTVTPGQVDITLVGPTVSVAPGTLTLTRTVDLQGPTVSVTPGTLQVARTIDLVGPTVAITAGTLTVTPGQVDIDLVGPTVAATPGNVTIAPGPAAIDLTGPTVAATPGVLSVAAGNFDIVLSAPVATATPGTLEVTPGTAAVSLTGPTVAVTPGDLSLAASVDLEPPVVDVTPGTVSVLAGPPVVTLATPTVTVTPGSLAVTGGLVITAAPQIIEITETGTTVTVVESSQVDVREDADVDFGEDAAVDFSEDSNQVVIQEGL